MCPSCRDGQSADRDYIDGCALQFAKRSQRKLLLRDSWNAALPQRPCICTDADGHLSGTTSQLSLGLSPGREWSRFCLARGCVQGGGQAVPLYLPIFLALPGVFDVAVSQSISLCKTADGKGKQAHNSTRFHRQKSSSDPLQEDDKEKASAIKYVTTFGISSCKIPDLNFPMIFPKNN